MQYLITFLEGMISFLSPCMLPMLPLYISYFAGGAGEKKKVILHAAAFVLGFTLLFSGMGVFAGTLGSFLSRWRNLLNLFCGGIVVLFGLSYLEVIRLPFFRGMQSGRQVDGVFSAFLFGIVYSLSLTPCVGAFLGSALMMASASGTVLRGLLLLVFYSLGLGIPFLLSAVLIDRLEAAFDWIKRNYRTVNLISGWFLIGIGILMAAGLMNAVLSVFS